MAVRVTTKRCQVCRREFPCKSWNRVQQVRCQACQYEAKMERARAAYWERKEEVKGCVRED